MSTAVATEATPLAQTPPLTAAATPTATPAEAVTATSTTAPEPSPAPKYLKKRCAHDSCIRQPSHGMSGTVVPLYCPIHAPKGMVNVKRKRCAQEGCLTAPGYAVKGCPAVRCARHALEGMVDVKNKKCLGEGCEKAPSYGLPGTRKTLYCSQHAPDNMVNIVNVKRCKEENCEKHPTYGVEGTTRAEYCLKHAKPGMVNMKDRRCAGENCKRQPSFAAPGAKQGIFCMQHAEEGMINVIRRPCAGDKECRRVPFFNVKGSKSALYCSTHALAGMVDVKTKRCLSKGCRKPPCYGHREDTDARAEGVDNARKATGGAMYCADHAEKSMVRITKGNSCEADLCNKIPLYGKKGTTRALFCSDHRDREPDLENVRSKPRCTRSGCDNRPAFGFPVVPGKGREGQRGAVVCRDHAEDGMVDLETNKKVVADGVVQVAATVQKSQTQKKPAPKQQRKRRVKPTTAEAGSAAATSGPVRGSSGPRRGLYRAVRGRRPEEAGCGGDGGESANADIIAGAGGTKSAARGWRGGSPESDAGSEYGGPSSGVVRRPANAEQAVGIQAIGSQAGVAATAAVAGMQAVGITSDCQQPGIPAVQGAAVGITSDWRPGSAWAGGVSSSGPSTVKSSDRSSRSGHQGFDAQGSEISSRRVHGSAAQTKPVAPRSSSTPPPLEVSAQQSNIDATGTGSVLPAPEAPPSPVATAAAAAAMLSSLKGTQSGATNGTAAAAPAAAPAVFARKAGNEDDSARESGTAATSRVSKQQQEEKGEKKGSEEENQLDVGGAEEGLGVAEIRKELGIDENCTSVDADGREDANDICDGHPESRSSYRTAVEAEEEAASEIDVGDDDNVVTAAPLDVPAVAASSCSPSVQLDPPTRDGNGVGDVLPDAVASGRAVPAVAGDAATSSIVDKIPPLTDAGNDSLVPAISSLLSGVADSLRTPAPAPTPVPAPAAPPIAPPLLQDAAQTSAAVETSFTTAGPPLVGIRSTSALVPLPLTQCGTVPAPVSAPAPPPASVSQAESCGLPAVAPVTATSHSAATLDSLPPTGDPASADERHSASVSAYPSAEGRSTADSLVVRPRALPSIPQPASGPTQAAGPPLASQPGPPLVPGLHAANSAEAAAAAAGGRAATGVAAPPLPPVAFRRPLLPGFRQHGSDNKRVGDSQNDDDGQHRPSKRLKTDEDG